VKDLFADFAPPPTGPYPAVPVAPLAARDDPETSAKAGADLIASGRLKGQAAAVLRLVQLHPGCTYRELHHRQDASNIEAPGVMKRLNDLHKAGFVRVTGSRRCEVGGVECQTWEAVEQSESPTGEERS
jgi:hypothetical protein